MECLLAGSQHAVICHRHQEQSGKQARVYASASVQELMEWLIAGSQHAAICHRHQEQSQGECLEVLADCLPQECL